MTYVTVETLHRQLTAIAEAIDLCRQWAGQSPSGDGTHRQGQDEEEIGATTRLEMSKQHVINDIHHLLEPLKDRVVEFAVSLQSDGHVLQRTLAVRGPTPPAGCDMIEPTLGADDMCTKMTTSLLVLSQMRGYQNRVAVTPIGDGALRNIKKHMQMDGGLLVKHNTFHRDMHGCVRVMSRASKDQLDWVDVIAESWCPSPEEAATFVEELVKIPRQQDCEAAAYQRCRARYQRNNPSRLHAGEYLEDMGEHCELVDEMLYIGRPGSVRSMGRARWNLRSATVGDRGHRVWTLIATTDTDKFRSWVREVWGSPESDVDISHLGLLIPPSVLDSAGIRYEVWVQRPGMMVITEPGQYHQIVSYSACVARSIHFLFPGEQLQPGTEVTLTTGMPSPVEPERVLDTDTEAETRAQDAYGSLPNVSWPWVSAESSLMGELGAWMALQGDEQTEPRPEGHYGMGPSGMSATIIRAPLGYENTPDGGAEHSEVANLAIHVDNNGDDSYVEDQNDDGDATDDDEANWSNSAGQDGATIQGISIEVQDEESIRMIANAVQSVSAIKQFVSLVQHAKRDPNQRTRRPLSEVDVGFSERRWLEMAAKRILLIQASKDETEFAKVFQAYYCVRLWEIYDFERSGRPRIPKNHIQELARITNMPTIDLRKWAYRGKNLAEFCQVYRFGFIYFVPTSTVHVEGGRITATEFQSLGQENRWRDRALFYQMLDDAYMRRICHAGTAWLEGLDNGMDIEFTWEGQGIDWDTIDWFGRAEAVQPKSFTSPDPEVSHDTPDNVSEQLDSLISDAATNTYSSDNPPGMSLGSGGLLDSQGVNPVSQTELEATTTHPDTTPADVGVIINSNFGSNYNFDSNSASTGIANVPTYPTMTEGLNNAGSIDTMPQELTTDMGAVAEPIPMPLASTSEGSGIDVYMSYDAGDMGAESGHNVGSVQPLDGNIDMAGNVVSPSLPNACSWNIAAWGAGGQHLWRGGGGGEFFLGDLASSSFSLLGCPSPLNQDPPGMDISTPWSLVDLGSARTPSDQTYQETPVGTNRGDNFSTKEGDQQFGLV
ncbi:hypothetical protein FDECE_9560 [Fusarium decemcellulare]|nr:hypothetical protein FDECE_9560 [Fusarium decemcellulare]